MVKKKFKFLSISHISWFDLPIDIVGLAQKQNQVAAVSIFRTIVSMLVVGPLLHTCNRMNYKLMDQEQIMKNFEILGYVCRSMGE